MNIKSDYPQDYIYRPWPKEKKMTNKEFLKRASKLQKDYIQLRKKGMGLIGMNHNYFHIRDDRFHKLEKEKLLEHISKELTPEREYWRYEAMTLGGVKVIALEDVKTIEDKK